MNWIEQKTLGFFVKTKGRISKPIFGGVGHILMLHRILPKQERNQFTFTRDLAITPEHLEFCINYFIENNYDFISMDSLYQRLTAQEKFKKRFVVFTIDDGYKDNIAHGLPIFSRYNIPFTIFVATCFPEGNGILWWYLLEKTIREKKTVNFELNKKKYDYSWNNESDAQITYNLLNRTIRELPPEDYQQRISNILGIEEHALNQLSEEITLSWDEIREASNHPLITIGAHTLKHQSLAFMREEQVRIEMLASKQLLEQKIFKLVEHFAYPYGGFSDSYSREFRLAKELGFKTAVINYPGNIFTKHKHSLEKLPRMPLGNNTTFQKLEQISNGITHFGNNGFKKHV